VRFRYTYYKKGKDSMQQTDELLEAIERYLAGNATAAQRQLVNEWYHSFDDELVTVETVDVAYEELLEARLRLRLAESTGIGAAGKTEVKRVRLWPRIAVAAAAVAAITLGTWIYMNVSPDVKSGDEVAKVNDIAPGKNGATITLANGKVIELDSAKNGVIVGDGKLAYYSSLRGGTTKQSPLHDEIASIPRNDGEGKQQITASTAKGQTYQFTLPDGSKVWLNADSKLEFPSSFVNSNTRNVKLTGEGYFEVSKDKTHPFIVDTRRQKIEVLGTHFNVSAYANDVATKTTLLEGKVAVTENRSRLTLDPGDQAYSGLDGIRALTLSNPEDAMAWKDGKYRFENASLEEVMRQLSRWYDIEVEYEGPVPERSFTGGIDRNANLSTAIAILKNLNISFELKGRTITIRNHS